MFSDYIVYVDESGDHNLQQVSPNYPMFVLAFCIFEKETYVTRIVPAFQRLKFKWFGHDAVVFHEREIRKQIPPFGFLKSELKRAEFQNELSDLMENADFTVIAAAIHKERLNGRYQNPGNPYETGLKFCMERLHSFLREKGQTNHRTHCIFERRGKLEDQALELEFRRICDGANFNGRRFDCLEIEFLDKAANSAGLQISDLVARPIGLAELRPDQPNRAYDIIRKKFRSSPAGKTMGYGLKTFP